MERVNPSFVIFGDELVEEALRLFTQMLDVAGNIGDLNAIGCELQQVGEFDRLPEVQAEIKCLTALADALQGRIQSLGFTQPCERYSAHMRSNGNICLSCERDDREEARRTLAWQHAEYNAILRGQR